MKLLYMVRLLQVLVLLFSLASATGSILRRQDTNDVEEKEQEYEEGEPEYEEGEPEYEEGEPEYEEGEPEYEEESGASDPVPTPDPNLSNDGTNSNPGHDNQQLLLPGSLASGYGGGMEANQDFGGMQPESGIFGSGLSNQQVAIGAGGLGAAVLLGALANRRGNAQQQNGFGQGLAGQKYDDIGNLGGFDSSSGIDSLLSQGGYNSDQGIMGGQSNSMFQSEQITTTRPTTNRPTTRTPTTRTPTTRRPSTGRPTTGRPMNRRPTTRRPMNRRPTTRRPMNRRPTTRRPIIRRLTTRRPMNRRPANRRPMNRSPTTRRPIIRRPTTRRPMNRRPTTMWH